VPPRVVLGVWEREQFVGVVIFSRGASPALGTPYGLAANEVAELTRVALREHEHPVTQIVAAAIRWLKANNPGLRLLVSFADPEQGHHGGIYQAGNWTYTGQTANSVAYVDRKGRRWHNRQVSSSGVRTQFGSVRTVVSISECTTLRIPGKHRYLLPLDRRMRRQISALAQPYPSPEVVSESRGGGLDGEPPVVPSGSAGSTPARRS
jgi:hypothetical protein